MFPQQELSDTGRLVATALILSGNVLTIAVIWCLGRSFSFVPEARRLVTAGPYSVIRHPLYVAEEVMFAGTTLLYLSPVTLALLALHFGVQVQRMLYEEDVLSRAFPEYASYSRRTWRVVPGVW
ncbi:MAG: isoprenylcysteine carboxylmethyltransferase family protein, partial [Rhodopila sp.]|nr:isoprenylcysteine carboxylmethyltransferase family protein [Rhodopila sp.]